jgi:hypothetical protein
VVDRQTLPLPEELLPGQYRLIAGWYNPLTGERIPVTHADHPEDGGDFVGVDTVTVK